MKLKSLIVSVALLALVAGIVFYARRPAPPPSTDARLGQPLLDRAAVEQAAKFTLSDQGKTVNLARQSDGTWRVSSYYDLPADFSKLSNLVGSLAEAKLERLVTSNPERISRLEFKDTKIALADAGGKDFWSITLGKTPEIGGGRYVRFGDEQKAYLASLNAWLDPESKNWANAELLNVKPDDVASIELPFADGGPVTLSRAKKEDAWTATPTPANQRLNAGKVSSLISSVTNLRFSETTDFTEPNFIKAKENLRTVTLTTFDKKTIKVALGRKPEEKKIKPPVEDGKSGPAALGSVSDLAKKDSAEKSKADPAKPTESKPLAPEFDTIAAGPVYAIVNSSDTNAPVNALMAKRAFQVSEYVFTSLPQKPEELFEPAPPPTPLTAPATQPGANTPTQPKPAEKK